VTSWSRTEREALCDLLEQLGPDQPTRCAGWTTRDLAAHLLVRERRPDAAAGIVLSALSGHTARVQAALAASRPFSELVASARRPPRWSPLTVIGPIEAAINTSEYFIHHEDVRRAQPDWQPRDLPADLERLLWRHARTQARFALRRFPGQVQVVATGYGEVIAGRRAGAHPKDGQAPSVPGPAEPVRLVGRPGELVLFLSGRQPAARVELTGPPGLVQRLATARLGV
jgi:uncharacterized protein (TIGR03085 family)